MKTLRLDHFQFDAWNDEYPGLFVRVGIPRTIALRVIREELGVSDVSLLVGARSGLLLSDFGQFVDLDAFRERANEKGNGPMDESTFNPGNWFLDLA